MKLSIIIPAYNEEDNIKKGVLSDVANYLKKQKFGYEVLIVDDGSKDETARFIEEQIKNNSSFKLIKNQHGGKAITVMTGLLAARGEIAVFTDMDQATPISEIEKLLPKFNLGVDIVIGSRHGRKGAPLIRKLMAWGFATFRNLILGLAFTDTQCGFKAFNIKSREAIFPKLLEKWQKHKTTGAAVNAGFDVETLYFAKKLGFKITEVEVDWHHVGTERVQMVRDSIDAIQDILRIKLDDFRGRYK